MKYFTVPLLLALLSVALCAKAALGEDQAICNTTCQCFAPDQPLPFATTHTPRSIPEKASTVKLASNFDAAKALTENPAVWALTFPYFDKWRLEDAMVKESMRASLPCFKHEKYFMNYNAGYAWGYGGYATKGTWLQFDIAPKNEGFRLERRAAAGPTISLACVTKRIDCTPVYERYTFPERKGDGFYPKVMGKDMSMCVWAAYEEKHPPICSDDCGTNVECRYRTVKSIGAIVWAIDRKTFTGIWQRDALNFIEAFLKYSKWNDENKLYLAYLYYRRGMDVMNS